MSLSIEGIENGGIAVLSGGRPVATAARPIETVGPAGSVARGYSTITSVEGSLVGSASWDQDGVSLNIDDTWTVEAQTRVTIRRTLTSRGESKTGIQLRLTLLLEDASDRHFFVPGMVYSPDQWSPGGTFCYSDARLAYPIVAGVAGGVMVSLLRMTPADADEAPRRNPGQSVFLQRTQLGSVGFRPNELAASWPYFEGDRSATFDAAGTSACALYPLDQPLAQSLAYAIDVLPADHRVDALRAVFDLAESAARPQPVAATVDLAESIELRLDSAAKTFATSDGFAGFRLNFDPERGYDSDPKAFGASFAEHAMSGTHDILEYGFTGRQLNIAYSLAKREPGEWSERGAAVVDSFVERMSTPSGWVHTHWDLAANAPVFACGDPRGALMHYLGESALAGTYTRLMAEAGRDLLLNIALHRELGADTEDWLACAEALGRYFVRVQESDGSWFRAYAPNGEPIVDSDWFGYRSGSGKTATASVIPFLTALAEQSFAAPEFLGSARRAGNYVQAAAVDSDEYRGGTLDNPNVVDKEAAFLVMQAMLALAETDGDNRVARLEAARRAATFAITWHSLWTVPAIEGTRVGEAAVNSIGWGGINSIWGVGVTDIYSLFFAADLVRLTRLTGDARFARMAELIARSSVELLSIPGNSYGFSDSGMQPEGISFCSQGEDDGLIRKGDLWGGLGWPYTAGTYGLETYLRERDQPDPCAGASQRNANHSQRRK